MVVVPGLSEFLRAVDKRIVRFDAMNTLLSVDVASSARRARCPSCSHGSSRWHGQYWRQLKAQPCMGRSVNLSVQVRRFKCINPQCARTTFVEQIDSLAAANQRRTVGLDRAWSAMAQALGGSAAARLSAKLGMPVSRDTLHADAQSIAREMADLVAQARTELTNSYATDTIADGGQANETGVGNDDNGSGAELTASIDALAKSMTDPNLLPQLETQLKNSGQGDTEGNSDMPQPEPAPPNSGVQHRHRHR